jgi:hypothetical protein
LVYLILFINGSNPCKNSQGLCWQSLIMWRLILKNHSITLKYQNLIGFLAKCSNINEFSY